MSRAPGRPSLASRLPEAETPETKQKRAKHKEPEPEVDPLWRIESLMKFIGKNRTATDDFLSAHPDFPRFKIGWEWRFFPEDVKAWFKREQLRALEASTVATPDRVPQTNKKEEEATG